jgi:hypothetical protein
VIWISALPIAKDFRPRISSLQRRLYTEKALYDDADSRAQADILRVMTASLLIRPDGERLRDALAREELAGYRYVLYGWLFALSVVSLYLLATIPLNRTVYYLGIILVFAAVGLAGEGIRRAWPRHARISMGAILLVQISLLTAVLIVPDPLIASQAPPQIAFRTANFLYLYAFVIGTVLSYSR